MITLRLAWRNLWRHKRRTWLTVGAMVFSNVLLVFMLSLQLGSYRMMIDNTLQLFSGHLQVQAPGYQDTPKMRTSIEKALPLANQLRSEFPVNSIATRAIGFALASSQERSFGMQITGIEPEHEPKVSTVPGLIARGRYLQNDDYDHIAIGKVLARNLKVDVGDELTLVGSGRDGSFAAAIVEIVGIIDAGITDVDRHIAQVPLAFFQDTFGMGDHAHSIVFRAKTLELVPSLVTAVSTDLSTNRPDLSVLDWDALQPGLQQAIRSDMTSAAFMYLILTLLVAFSVLNTQLMSVLERTREFGILSALGFKPGGLARLVILETSLMASMGFIIGLALGGALALYINQVGFTYPGMDEMAARFNIPERMYPSLTALSLMAGPAVVFIGCLLAALYPAFKLLRLHPVEAMRAAQ